MWKPSGSFFYLGADGDDMGSRVGEFILSNKVSKAIDLSRRMRKAEGVIHRFVSNRFGGRFILSGGDDILIQASSNRFDPKAIEEMRKLYHKITGGTMTVGVGDRMADAARALVVGKNTGKDKVVYWTPDKRKLYDKVIADRCNDLITKCRAEGGMIGMKESFGDVIASMDALRHRFLAKVSGSKLRVWRRREGSLAKLRDRLMSRGRGDLARRVEVKRRLAAYRARRARARAIRHRFHPSSEFRGKTLRQTFHILRGRSMDRSAKRLRQRSAEYWAQGSKMRKAGNLRLAHRLYQKASKLSDKSSRRYRSSLRHFSGAWKGGKKGPNDDE